MEKGLKMLCQNGSFAMIVPFPLSNQVYGRNFRKWVTANYDVWEITDLNGTKIFENATVSNLIMFAKNDVATDQTTISHIVPPMSILPDFTQSISNLVPGNDTAVWNFTRQKIVPKSHPAMKTLGDFCYISVGMVLNADETKAKGEFSKTDLISSIQDSIHPRTYIEAKDIERYRVKRVRYLEYNTERCPNKLRRPTFRELYDRDKIIINCLGTINCTLDNNIHYLHNHSIYCAVLWKDLNNVDNKSISASVKRYSHHSRKEMEEFSETVCLEYLTAILNSSYAAQLLSTLRGDDYHIYPEHIRNIPIPPASSTVKTRIKHLVHQIIDYKQSDKDCTASETELDEIILKLYKPGNR